jgi:hypothetical protein
VASLVDVPDVARDLTDDAPIGESAPESLQEHHGREVGSPTRS